MKITTVLFDLDGTLLPMDQNAFIKAYFGGLARRLAPHGYDPQKLIDAIWQGAKSACRPQALRRAGPRATARFAGAHLPGGAGSRAGARA